MTVTRESVIAAAVGLHARPASRFVQEVQALGLPVSISAPGRPAVDARSLLSVLTLGVAHGETVELAVDSAPEDAARAAAALDRLVELLAVDHDAPEA